MKRDDDDAGVVWKSEALFQEQVGHPISRADIPDSQNTTAIYAGAEVRGASHEQAARQWLTLIRSPAAFQIFKRYGFGQYELGKENSPDSRYWQLPRFPTDGNEK